MNLALRGLAVLLIAAVPWMSGCKVSLFRSARRTMTITPLALRAPQEQPVRPELEYDRNYKHDRNDKYDRNYKYYRNDKYYRNYK